MSYEVQTQNNLMVLSDIVNNNTPEAIHRKEITADFQQDRSRMPKNTLNTLGKEESAPSLEPSSFSSLQMHKLQDRMNQLEKAVLGLGKKESYVAAMAVDLEHIMMILIKRLDREGNDKAVTVF